MEATNIDWKKVACEFAADLQLCKQAVRDAASARDAYYTSWQDANAIINVGVKRADYAMKAFRDAKPTTQTVDAVVGQFQAVIGILRREEG